MKTSPVHLSNVLSREMSPYLLQHANNPVHWQVWSEETLALARASDRLLLISIGYATCHWCHVMEKETFEDQATADIMNAHFINIKVDREELPDVDEVYMNACQLMSGRGCGWPLNVIALADGSPIWIGTYVPKTHWHQILHHFIQLKDTSPDKLRSQGDHALRALREINVLQSDTHQLELTILDVKSAINRQLLHSDLVNGGLKGAPKFPMPPMIQWMMAYGHKYKDKQVNRWLDLTLDRMIAGGLYDLIEGGFSRYSVDEGWRIPHFEKMLYDNAQLLDVYADAFKRSGNPMYEKILSRTIQWLVDNMLDKDSGAFYSAMDADSQGIEGLYYTWTKHELRAALPDPIICQLVEDYYGVTQSGNWEDGLNILHETSNLGELASRYDRTVEEISSQLDQAHELLIRARRKRSRPITDTKIITGWNALTTYSLLKVYEATGDETAFSLALDNMYFITDNLLIGSNQLKHAFHSRSRIIKGYLTDYAYTIQALLSVFRHRGHVQDCHLAIELTDYVLAHFLDEKSGLFYMNEAHSNQLIYRPMSTTDGVMPCGNSIMLENLWIIGTLQDDDKYIQRALKMMRSMADTLSTTNAPAYYGAWWRIIMNIIDAPIEVIVTGPDAMQVLTSLNKHYLPGVVLAAHTDEIIVPLMKGRMSSSTKIYVCQNKTCQLPVDTATEALDLLKTMTKI